MEKIIPTRYYSGLEAVKLLQIKSRQNLIRDINNGFLIAIQVGVGKHIRYSIRGEWILDYQKRKENGLTKKIGKKEIKSVIKIVTDFCDKNKITTIEQLKKKIK